MERMPRVSHIGGFRIDETGCEVDDLVFCGAVKVHSGPDEHLATLVELALDSQWKGLEALAGVTGTVAGAVRENVERFGQAAGDSVESVRTWDRLLDAQCTFAAADCLFEAGTSRFAEELADGCPRYEILEVVWLLEQGDLISPVRDEGLAELLGVDLGQRVTLSDVAAAVRRA